MIPSLFFPVNVRIMDCVTDPLPCPGGLSGSLANTGESLLLPGGGDGAFLGAAYSLASSDNPISIGGTASSSVGVGGP